MENNQQSTQDNFDGLSLDEKILITAPSKLIKHLRALETAKLIDAQTTASLIGCVKKIVGIAENRGRQLQDAGVRI